MSESAPRSIFIGTEEIAAQISEIATGLRTLGHAVTTATRSRSPYYPDAEYDYVMQGRISDSLPGIAAKAARSAERAMWPLRNSRQIIAQHDTFIFLFGRTLRSSNRDLHVLANLGKTVISVFLGSDIRHWSAAQQFRDAVGLTTYDGYRQGRTLDEALHTLRLAELNSDRLYFQPSYGELAIRPYRHLFIACDPARFDFNVPARVRPRVLHVPSRRAVKGTADILAAVADLRAEGVEFDFDLLEGMPNAEVRRALADADVLIDEISEANYGMLALEALASGCAVAAGNRVDIVPIPPSRPILHVTPATLRDTLRSLVEDRDRRVKLAQAGREYVSKFHAPVTVARDLLEADAPDRVYQPRFFTEDFQLAPGVHMSSASRRLNGLVADRVSPSGQVRKALEARDLAFPP